MSGRLFVPRGGIALGAGLLRAPTTMVTTPLRRPMVTTTKRMSDWILWRQKPWKEKLGVYFRVVRIPIIAYGIFTIGYRQGVIESHRNPYAFQEQILDTILLERTNYKVDRQDIDVLVLNEQDLQYRKAKRQIKTNRYYQIASVANELIGAARDHVREQLDEAKLAVRQRESQNRKDFLDRSLPVSQSLEEMQDDLFEAHLEEAYSKDPMVKKWREAKVRIEGDELNVDPWRFVFLGSGASPNAWVTELLPKRIFITKTITDFCENIDEMAFIMAHEVSWFLVEFGVTLHMFHTTLNICKFVLTLQVSHLVLGHLGLANEIEMSLKTTEIVLLSLDPTAGLVTFAIVGILNLFQKAIEMSFSRRHEREADELGLKLLARCNGKFDLEAGAKFMFRLHNAEESGGKTGWLDSHPASLERARQIYQESKNMSAQEQQALAKK